MPNIHLLLTDNDEMRRYMNMHMLKLLPLVILIIVLEVGVFI
jgi:hypothetical protein